MRYKFSSSIHKFGIHVFLVAGLVISASAQSTTPQQSAQSDPNASVSKASGERIVVGCVAKDGADFVLKADDGTYPLNTDRDLTPYVGKKVRIAGRWEATGTTTTAPISASKSAAPQASATQQAAVPQAFRGDLHLHITGDVIGDCATQK